jgi:hypothetical protein
MPGRHKSSAVQAGTLLLRARRPRKADSGDDKAEQQHWSFDLEEDENAE